MLKEKLRTPFFLCMTRVCLFVLVAALLPNATLAVPVQWTAGSGSNGHWYEAICVPNGINWSDARDAAPSILPGGYLATITSEAENEFVFSLLGDDKYWVDSWRGPWLGGTDEETEGVWRWVTGEPWGYTNWAVTQPDNARGNEDYLHFHWGIGNASAWNDLANDWTPGPTPHGYVVETPVPEPATVALLGLGGLALLRRKRA